MVSRYITSVLRTGREVFTFDEIYISVLEADRCLSE